jgi:oxygen-independent coproporphyrinogen-3 oxidase
MCTFRFAKRFAGNRAHRLTSYLDALHAEIETVVDRLGKQHAVTQIAFGGGSPNALDPIDFVRLLDHLLIAFGAFDARLSIELDPRSMCDGWEALIGRAGITHASLGVQTFDPDLQARIGRVQPVESIKQAVAHLRRAGIQSLNFDLMYGLPGQSCDALVSSIEQTITLGPDRIALFGYAHLPNVIKRQRQIDDSDMPDTATRFEMAAIGFERLTGAGYVPIGFDHFARPGDSLAQACETGQMRRNFQGFTDDPCETLIGLGASAISSFPDRIVQNAKNSGQYRILASAGMLSGERGVLRTAEDNARGRVIESLLCDGQANLSEIDVPAALETCLEELSKLGLIELRAGDVAIATEGLPYSRVIAALFDGYRVNSEARLSSAV